MILIVPTLDSQHKGGIERVCQQVLRALKEWRELSGPHWVLSANDCDTITTLKEMEDIHIRFFRKRYWQMLLSAALTSYKDASPPILCMHAGLSPVARILASRLHTAYGVFLHGVEVWRYLPLRTRWGLNGSRCLFSNSEFTRCKFLELQQAFTHTPIQSVPLGLSEDIKKETSGHFHPPFKQYILTVSRLEKADRYKGQTTLLEAFALVHKNQENIGLVIVGDGNDRPFLEAQVKQFNLQSFVQFVGSVSDTVLANLYSHCFAFALLSEGEGFGLVHLEAMWRSKPCLATTVDAAREIIDDGKTGALVPPRQPKLAAEVLLQWLSEPLAAQRMGKAGRQRVEKHFMEHHFRQRLLAALQPLLVKNCSS